MLMPKPGDGPMSFAGECFSKLWHKHTLRQMHDTHTKKQLNISYIILSERIRIKYLHIL